MNNLRLFVGMAVTLCVAGGPHAAVAAGTPAGDDLPAVIIATGGVGWNMDVVGDKVWGGQHETDSNVIEVFVCHLRNKIGDENNQVIRTIRGVGYFFARS